MVAMRGHLMVVKSVKVVYCDRCGSDNPTSRYTIRFPDTGRRTFDLCAKCAEPLDELATLLDSVGTAGPKKHQQPILTEDEVEALVRKAREGTQTAT